MSNRASEGRAFALKFISGKYQGGEFPLRQHREFVIGRASDLDIVLSEEMVSRKHATIEVSPDQILLRDLGSTNGTFVNGEKIKQALLKEGDRILIGTSILKLIQNDPDQPAVAPRLAEPPEETHPSKAKGGGAMSGRIEEVPLPDLLQLFSTSRKTGVLAVRNAAQQGHIHLRQGRIVYAEIDADRGLGPRKSLFRILTWEKGDFVLQPGDLGQFPVELEDSTEGLLMEGMRQLDELRRVQKDIPAEIVNLGLTQPLVAPLRELSDEQLDVLQAAINYSSVGSILRKSSLTDCETVDALLHLLKNDYLRQV